MAPQGIDLSFSYFTVHLAVLAAPPSGQTRDRIVAMTTDMNSEVRAVSRRASHLNWTLDAGKEAVRQCTGDDTAAVYNTIRHQADINVLYSPGGE